ncbi:6-phospho-3-hexuloisomerase [Arcticibacter eurypsychrophilus]|uniref:6-phospho-3-hexuloisomerase n=1 Tax=Arcticibacter eurypsychrophilus TaxID=1434752 RepID=UPI001039E777|nr:6-phospho-3-hexuloisomerase [Arcticibacter eurypsychrophilus]
MELKETEINEMNFQRISLELQSNLDLIMDENLQLAKNINTESIIPLINSIQESERIFLVATGRSGLALRGAAMRFMHLGRSVFVVGDTTTPAIRKNDLLIAASGSGTTSLIVKAAEKASALGVKIVALTTAPLSPLAKLADHTVFIPAAGKQETGGDKSKQFAGSLFEQFLLLLMDVVFHSLWKLEGKPAEELWERHANLE